MLGNEQQSQTYSSYAVKRKSLINQYLWSNEKRFFVDYNHKLSKPSAILSAAASTPLFVNLASQQQAELVANVLSKQFLKVGGIVTTVVDTPQQWDSPNGWAPLQWFAVKGLHNYGIDQLATRIMKNWLTMVEQDFIENKCLLEKYNVCTPQQKASGGEYQVQQGFGWTNGVTSRFYTLL